VFAAWAMMMTMMMMKRQDVAMGEFFESWNLHVRSLLTPRFASFRLRSQNPNKSPSSLRLEFDRFGYEAKVRVSTQVSREPASKFTTLIMSFGYEEKPE
jgi:hypothetical protein